MAGCSVGSASSASSGGTTRVGSSGAIHSTKCSSAVRSVMLCIAGRWSCGSPGAPVPQVSIR
eukprot:4954083-Prymnesium_polylepis.2